MCVDDQHVQREDLRGVMVLAVCYVGGEVSDDVIVDEFSWNFERPGSVSVAVNRLLNR